MKKLNILTKKSIFILMIIMSSILTLKAQEIYNYDEAKVGTYKLPPVLTLANGKSVASKAGWEKRRFEILNLFQENIYGRIPAKPRNIHFEVLKMDLNALSGKAISKQIRVYFTKEKKRPYMDVILYLPKTKKPVPVFVGFNFKGNQSINNDTSIILSEKHPELLKATANPKNQLIRGEQDFRWEVDTLIKRGYGTATAYYGDLELDYAEGWKTGIRTAMQTELGIKPNEWGAISVWAWGLSRVVDYLETDKQIDAKKIIVHGHSRLGKASLWAGANDTRFAAVISNDSGEGGAALSNRWFGETVNTLNRAFPWWFVEKYKLYNNNAAAMPIDQHMLLSLNAPRPLYVASATKDLWADPKGEFLSAKNAEPVYALFGKKGLGRETMPPADTSIGKTIRYHNRTGIHNILLFDWLQYIKFADSNLK